MFDVFVGVDKVLCIVVVFFNVGGDCEDVWVEDDIFWWEVNFFGEDFVCLMVNFDFLCVGIGLFLFVKGYYYYCCIVMM